MPFGRNERTFFMQNLFFCQMQSIFAMISKRNCFVLQVIKQQAQGKQNNFIPLFIRF